MNIGKTWEARFKRDWEESKEFIYRLPDQMSGFSGSKNICDFIGYNYPYIYLLEIKETKQSTFNVNFRQYDSLVKYADRPGIKAGVVIWFSTYQKVYWVPIETFIWLKENGKKSFSIKDPTVGAIEIPSVVKRKYPRCDFSNF